MKLFNLHIVIFFRTRVVRFQKCACPKGCLAIFTCFIYLTPVMSTEGRGSSHFWQIFSTQQCLNAFSLFAMRSIEVTVTAKPLRNNNKHFHCCLRVQLEIKPSRTLLKQGIKGKRRVLQRPFKAGRVSSRSHGNDPARF